jgi:hypothetical protein
VPWNDGDDSNDDDVVGRVVSLVMLSACPSISSYKCPSKVMGDDGVVIVCTASSAVMRVLHIGHVSFAMSHGSTHD